MSTPVTTTDRYTAAKALRTELHNLILNGTSPAGTRMTSHERQYLEEYLGRIEVRINAIVDHLHVVQQQLREGKRKDPQTQVTRVLMLLDNVRTNRNYIAERIGSYKAPSSSPSGDMLHRLYGYAQCLPTVEDIPETDAENILRAICALLRNHRWPGAETLTQKATEGGESNGQDVEQVLTEIAGQLGSPVPVGAAPGQTYDEGTDDEDGDGYDEDS